MNVKIAADKCKPFIAGCTNLPDHHPEYGKDHLFEMIEKIGNMQLPEKTEKAMRWLGWLQACIVMGGGATLEQMKQINVES